MSIEAPQGILNIPNATLRVGKLVVNEVVGADTILNTVARNTILLVDGDTYHENKNWDLKLPNAWAGEFECNTASAGNYSEFNFYNEGATSNAQGYNLTFNDTAVQLRYDGTLLTSGTLASTVTGTGVKKVRLLFERTILSVTVDGTLIFTHNDTGGPRPRVYSTTAGGFLNFFTDGGALKNLKIVNEKWISDGTSNIAYVGGNVTLGAALDVVGNVAVDTNTLFVDSVGNKVGIGTASPIEDLHIQADASPQILVEDTGVANQASIRFKTGVTDWAVGQHGATNVGDFKISNYTELGTNDRIIIDTIGDVAISSNLAVDTNTLFVDSVGNKVGIGVTDPDAKLHVNGNAIIGDVGVVSGLTHQDAQLILGGSYNQGYNIDDKIKLLITSGDNDGGSPYYIMCQDENDHDQFFLKGGNTSSGTGGIMYFKGNVGIGTTNPSHGRMQILCSSQTPSGGLTIRGGNYNAGLGAMWVEGSGSGQRFNIQAYKNESTDPPSGVNPSVLDADVFELCLNPKGGNVGIGKANPGSTLDVVGDVAISSALDVVGDVAISSDLAVRRAITIVNSEDTGFSNVVALSIQAKSSDYTSITNGYGSRIQFRTNRGTSGGGVSASADIKGYIYSGAGGGADYHGLDINVYGDNTSLNKGISILSTYGSGSPATTIMHGTVGIGVSPTYKLHVNGSLFYSSGGLNGSDDRIKYNEENITNALDIICKLKPQKYEKIMVFPSDATGSWIPTDENWETVKNAETKPWEGFTHGDEYGFIAQDVRNIPEVSFLVSGSEMKTVDESVSPEEYVNLNEDEQGTYTRKYVYEENVITIEEYTNLISENKDKCTGIYIKQVETQTPLGLNYQGIFVVAVKAIQEIDAQLQAEKAKVTTLESQLASVLTRLDALENA